MGKTVLVTGANRGVGLELTKAYLEKGWRVIATVRDTSKMPKVEGDIMIVKLEVGEKDDAKKAVAEIKKQGIDKIDVVIANAAVNLGCGEAFKDIDVDLQEETFRINVRGPLLLFQATLGMLVEGGVFVTISSGAGTIGQKHGKTNAIYGQSKAAVNFFISKIHYEHPELVVLALNPGWVPTEMGNEGAVLSGLKEAPEKFSDTIPGMLNVIDSAKKDTTSGKMVNCHTTPSSRIEHTVLITGAHQGYIKVIEDAKKDTTSGRLIKWDGTYHGLVRFG